MPFEPESGNTENYRKGVAGHIAVHISYLRWIYCSALCSIDHVGFFFPSCNLVSYPSLHLRPKTGTNSYHMLTFFDHL